MGEWLPECAQAQNAAPDLSLGKDDELVGNALEKAGVPGNASEVADSLRSKVCLSATCC